MHNAHPSLQGLGSLCFLSLVWPMEKANGEILDTILRRSKASPRPHFPPNDTVLTSFLPIRGLSDLCHSTQAQHWGKQHGLGCLERSLGMASSSAPWLSWPCLSTLRQGWNSNMLRLQVGRKWKTAEARLVGGWCWGPGPVSGNQSVSA